MLVGPFWQLGLLLNPWQITRHLRVYSRQFLPATAHSPADNAQLVPFACAGFFLANQRPPTVTLGEKSCLGVEGMVESCSYSLLRGGRLARGTKHLWCHWRTGGCFYFWFGSPTTCLYSQLCDCQKRERTVWSKAMVMNDNLVKK